MPNPADLAGRPHRPLTARPAGAPGPALPAPAAPVARPAGPPAVLPVDVPRLPDGTPFLQRYEMALRYSNLSPSARHVALCLALRANWHTGFIVRSGRFGYGRIAAATGLAETTVRTALERLAAAGFLVRVAAASRAQPSLIELVIPPALDPLR